MFLIISQEIGIKLFIFFQNFNNERMFYVFPQVCIPKILRERQRLKSNKYFVNKQLYLKQATKLGGMASNSVFSKKVKKEISNDIGVTSLIRL